MARKKIRLGEISRPGRSIGETLSWVTCYDYSFARVVEDSDVDMILVGDSGGMVSLGFPDTVPVTLDQMLMLAGAVRRGAQSVFTVGDMPKGSYEASDALAIESAMRFVKEAGVDAVKLEGGLLMAPRVKAIVDCGIPVFGHIGLTPQSAGSLGGYRVRGRSDSERNQLIADALGLQEAGATSILVEAVPPSISNEIRARIAISLFGIGAGPHLDGQLLILHDLLGLYPDFRPKFAKCFVPEGQAEVSGLESSLPLDGLAGIALASLNVFARHVRNGTFPNEEFSYSE